MIWCFRIATSDNKLLQLSAHSTKPERVVVSFVVCDERFSEALNVVKSVLVFTGTPVLFVIFADELLKPKFNETLTKWKSAVENQFDFELHKIEFPKAYEEDWTNLFKKCAAQRLFMPVRFIYL